MSEVRSSSLAASSRQTSREASGSSSLGVLIFYTLSIVVVCLTLFNFYLLSWLWSAQLAAQVGGLELVDGRIKFSGRLVLERQVQADKVFMVPDQSVDKQQISSESQVNLVDRSSDGREKSALNLLADQRELQFSNGLYVHSTATATSGQSRILPIADREPNIKCEVDATQKQDRSSADSKRPFCQVEAPIVRLSHLRGVDLSGKSVQTRRLITSHIHSPTNSLRLLSSKNTSEFKSHSGAIKLLANDELALVSLHSSVILNAKTIDVSQVAASALKRFNSKQEISSKDSRSRIKLNSDKQYKLCVCLSATQHHLQSQSGNISSSSILLQENTGLVFGIRPSFSCAQFNGFCRRRRQRYSHSYSHSQTMRQNDYQH